MATLSSILAWRMLWMEEPGRLWSRELQRVRDEWSDLVCPHKWSICYKNIELLCCTHATNGNQYCKSTTSKLKKKVVSVCVCFVKLALLMSCHILLHPHIRQHHPRSDCYFWNLECENHPIRNLWIWLSPLDLELKTQSWFHWPNLQTEDFLAKDVRNWQHT